MDINDLIDDFSVGIAQDADVLEWSNQNFGKDLKVFVNFDQENPPGADDCPLAAVIPESKRFGQTIRDPEHIVNVIACVRNNASRQHPSVGNITEYQGVSQIEDLRKLIETALVGLSDLGNATLDFEVEYDTITDFPFMWCYMAVIVKLPITMGADPLA